MSWARICPSDKELNEPFEGTGSLAKRIEVCLAYTRSTRQKSKLEI